MHKFKGKLMVKFTVFVVFLQIFASPLDAASVSVSVEVGVTEVYDLANSKENSNRALYQADPNEGSNSMFSVNAYTGVIAFLTPATWQENSNNTYTVLVTAGNGNSATDYEVVVEVNEPPLSVITLQDMIVSNPQLGAYVTIPIRLSSGEEDVGGVSFSLSFDHDVFEFEELTKSDPASGMILVVNDSLKESGEIGAALGGFGTVISAGDQVILEMELKIISLGSLGVKEIKFTDVPVATEVVTGSATSFVNEVVHGSVKLNSAPVAVTDNAMTDEDTALSSTVDLDANDTDVDGDALSVVGGTFTSNNGGTIIVSSDGSYTYTPAANFHGAETFDYTLTDGTLTDTGTLYITVSSVNDSPVANDDDYSMDEDAVLTVSVTEGLLLNDDIGGDGGDLKAILKSSPLDGTLNLSENGSFTYEPSENYHGSDTFTYSISDSDGEQATASVSILVNKVEDEATGTLAFSGTAQEGGMLTAVTSNISDADGGIEDFSYQWQSSSDNNAWSDIGGATGTTYSIADNQSMVDQYIRLTAVSTDSLGGTTSHTSNGSQILNVNDPPVSETVRLELSEEDAIAYGGTEVSASGGLLSMASDPDDPGDKSFTIESVSLAQITSESDDSSLVGTFKTQLDAVINIYEDGRFLYDASNLDFIKKLDKGQSIEDSVEFQIIDKNGGKSNLVNAIITINGNAYEGDINNDLSVDIVDFQMAGQYLVGLTTVPDDSIMAAVDCYPINEGGNDRFNISDWVQVGRFALGLDSIKTKAFVGEQVFVAGKQLPLNASSQITNVSQPIRRMQPLNFVQGGSTQLGFVSYSDSASAGDSMEFSVVLKNAAEVSGLSFTMKFDPDELMISEDAIELSDEARAEGFGVMLNANQASAGLMGVLIYAQPGELLGSSNAPLLQLKAEVLANHAQKRAEMQIVDWPVKSMASSIANRKVPVELVVELPIIKPITNYDDWADVIQQPVSNLESVIDVSDPDGDADGDGISNQLEFVFASNPYEKSSIAAYSTDKSSEDGSSQTLTISTAYMAERGLVDFTFKAVGSLGSLTKGNDSLKPSVNSSVVGGLVHESITLPLDGSMGFITYEIKVTP